MGICTNVDTTPLNGDYNRDPNIKALKRRGVINRGLH